MNKSNDKLLEETIKNTNYYAIIHNHLKKQYPTSDEKVINALTREAVFAPENYKVQINKKNLSIKSVRENLADFIERETSAKNFIPYSLSAEIANLIEQSSCETSSMNEYYRWVSATSEILNHTGDGDITPEDLTERRNFINMSYDREAEILLCLSLYEGAGREINREKINILRFKLARLREMRIIISETCNYTQHKHKGKRERLGVYCEYCHKLLKELPTFHEFNLNLTLNADHNSEDLDDNYSHLENLRAIILYMMRRRELHQTQNEHEEQQTAQQTFVVPSSKKALPQEIEGYRNL